MRAQAIIIIIQSISTGMLTNSTQSGLESITTPENTTVSQESTESSINILYPLVGFFTITVSAGLLVFGIRDLTSIAILSATKYIIIKITRVNIFLEKFPFWFLLTYLRHLQL